MSASNFRYAAKWSEGIRLAALIGTALISVAATSYAEDARPSADKPGLECDDTMKSADLGDPLAKVTLVKLFRTGERVMLAADTPESAPTTTIDLCLVKIMIGPGNDGPPDAPSTSKGIGVEVWLPGKQAWNTRYVGYGQSGYAGGYSFTATDKISFSAMKALNSAMSGYVTSDTDGGHTYGPIFDGSFALLPDGRLNWPLLKDWAYRSLHETATKTKALATAYYGTAPHYSYFSGGSTGGREGLMLAQRYPRDFDGIISAYPAINWTSFLPGIMWAQVVMQQDLGGPIAESKLEAVNAASIEACDKQLTGKHDGYINDIAACSYDPMKDKSVLCAADGGTGGPAICLTMAEARAVNKIWYGPRTDNQMIDPAVDNGWNTKLPQGQLWYGYNRGALLHNSPLSYNIGPAGLTPFTIGADWLAIVFQNPRYTTQKFLNASAKGANLWKEIGYTGDNSFTQYFIKSHAQFSALNATDSPDLSEFQKAGGKIIHWHGLADNQIPAGGSINYYERVMDFMGGEAATQKFYRFFLAAGTGHGRAGGPGVPPPVPGGDANNGVGINDAILPVIQSWVERGQAPEMLMATSGTAVPPKRERPWCVYPKKLKYHGGDVNLGGSFGCS